MKFNQWTLGLAAVGAVSLASVVSADEAKVSQVQTALSSTTLSGYVDVAAQYNLGNQSYDGTIAQGVSNTKIDSFSLNDIDSALDKPQDESPWASGYHVDLNYGTDAINAGLGPVRQAYVALRTPIGNGIDWKVGGFDNIIGYEGNTDGGNPNYTRSFGYQVEPTSYVGALANYKVNSAIDIQAGLANSYTAYNNVKSTSAKTYLADIAFTAPDSWGWLKGATLNVGVNEAFNGNNKTGGTYISGNSTANYYAGLTLPTPITALKVGAAFDWVNYANAFGTLNPKDNSVWVSGVYASYQATDKLSLNLRGEYEKFDTTTSNQGEEVTATVQYNLWANVISRAEFRWDHAAHGTYFGSNDQNANAYLVALNLIYQF